MKTRLLPTNPTKSVYALGLILLLLGVWISSVPAVMAKPPGDTRDPDVGKMLYKFNLIAKPNAWSQDDTVCENNGARIFFARDSTPWTIIWNFIVGMNGNYKISDCDGTTDRTAVVDVNENQQVYIMLRVLGPKTSSLTVTCTEVVDLGVDETMCLISTETFGKSNSFTKITQHIVDDAYEQVLWTLDPSTNFRIAQVRVYEKL